MFREIRTLIRKQIGITEILEKLDLISASMLQQKNLETEILYANIFNSTIADSIWFSIKGISPTGIAANYCFLYILYRILNDIKPKSIIEFGLGQSTKLISQYCSYFNEAEALTIEHDHEWIKYFRNNYDKDINIKICETELIKYKSFETLSYKNLNKIVLNKKFDLIIVDAPSGSEHFSRCQVIDLIRNNLTGSFCILIDDYNRTGEKETSSEILDLLKYNNITYYTRTYQSSREHFLICSKDLAFLTSL